MISYQLKHRLKKFQFPVIFCGCIAIAYWLFLAGTVKLGPGVKVQSAPFQRRIILPQEFQHNGYTITPLAEFSLDAKLISKERYRSDTESHLSPIDYTLGWQNMSDEAVISKITFSQSGRWTHWKARKLPLPQEEIESCMANMHMIPATDELRDQLINAPVGSIIAIKGKLIRADHSSGWKWISSLSRTDTGKGACEIVWVEKFKILEQ